MKIGLETQHEDLEGGIFMLGFLILYLIGYFTTLAASGFDPDAAELAILWPAFVFIFASAAILAVASNVFTNKEQPCRN